jgi:hypothetical protein
MWHPWQCPLPEDMPKFPAEANDTADVYELRAAVVTVATAGTNQLALQNQHGNSLSSLASLANTSCRGPFEPIPSIRIVSDIPWLLL